MEITAYELAKALHVLFIGLLLTVLIGGMAVAVLNRANPQELLARLQYRLALGLLLTAGLLVPASGLYMTQVAQFDLREFWLSSGNSVTILLALLAYAVCCAYCGVDSSHLRDIIDGNKICWRIIWLSVYNSLIIVG